MGTSKIAELCPIKTVKLLSTSSQFLICFIKVRKSRTASSMVTLWTGLFLWYNFFLPLMFLMVGAITLSSKQNTTHRMWRRRTSKMISVGVSILNIYVHFASPLCAPYGGHDQSSCL